MRELTEDDVRTHVVAATLVDEISRCLADLGRGEAHQAVKQVLPLGDAGFFLTMAGVVPRLGLGIAKWASYVPAAPGRPGASTSTVLVSDARDGATPGAPLAVLTGMAPTHLRTAAAAASALLAVRQASGIERVVLVGCGPTNRAVLDILVAVLPDLRTVDVLVRSASSRGALAPELDESVPHVRVAVGTDPSVVAGAQLVVTATGSRDPLADVDDLAPDGVALSLDGRRTWRTPPRTPVVADHAEQGTAPDLALLLAGRLPVPAGRLLLDVAGSAVADVALASVLLTACPAGEVTS